MTALRRSEALAALLDVLAARLPPSALEWFQRRVRFLMTRAFDRPTFLTTFLEAARYLGHAALVLGSGESRRLSSAGVSWPVGGWGQDDLGRALLLLRAAERLPEGKHAALVASCYQAGEARERQAVLRVLPFLPSTERFVDLAVDATRSDVPQVFEAIACENPYPAAHLGGEDFNELVIRALAHGVAIDRVVGLTDRVTPELVRLATAYAHERMGTGRALPPGIGRLLSLAEAGA